MARAKLRGFLRPGDADRDFDEEVEAHLEMAAEDKIRKGLSPGEARRQARKASARRASPIGTRSVLLLSAAGIYAT